MIEIERHIEILLLSNDCVIIPEFGGFVAHHVDARYDDKDFTFLPPTRTIGFNPQLKMNDSLLAQSYVEAYDISYPEALKRIESDVEELRQHLDNEGEYEMVDLGTFHVNSEGHYLFTPCEAGILTPSLYGLNSFEMQRIDVVAAADDATMPSANANTAATVSLKTETVSASSASIEPAKAISHTAEVQKKTASPTLQELIDDDDASDDRAISIRLSVLRNIAVAAIIVLVMFLWASPLGNNTGKVMQSSVDTGMLQRLMPKEKSTGTLKIAVKNQTNDKAATKETKKASPDAHHYSIILASKITHKNARAYISRLHKSGMDDAYMLDNGRIVRVAYGDYASKSEAYNDMRRLSANDDFSEAWVMLVK